MALRKQYAPHHAVSYELAESCGVIAAMLLPLLEKQAQYAHMEGIAIRELGQIRFPCKFADIKDYARFMGEDEFEDALGQLEKFQFVARHSTGYLVMADPYGFDPPKVTLKDEVSGKRHVYVFKTGDGLFKIGITIDLKRRSKELYPAEFVVSAQVPNAAKIERELHDKYRSYRKGGEWFRLPDPQVQALIDEVKALAS